MATSNGLIGNFRGKLGNIVGYQYIDANGHAVQAIRAYRPDVFNPKTLDQAQQRIKITNSVAFYKAFAQILSRSYEGRKNAHACYCRQQSLAMSMIYGETPAVPKGRRGFVPAFYIVAEGSLPERSVLSVGTDNQPQSFTTSLQVSITIDDATTLGELSQDLVDNNLNLLDGDTLYFLYAVQVGSIYYNPAITSLTLDVSSTTPLVSVLSPVEQLQSLEDDSHILRIAFRSIAAVRMSQRLAGAAVIQSRGSGSSFLNYSWSSSMMLPSDDVIAAWYSQEAFDQAIPSYLPPVPSPSELLLNQAMAGSGYVPQPPSPHEPILIEYLESTGGNWIITDVRPSDTIGISAEVMWDAFNRYGSESSFCGIKYNSNNVRYYAPNVYNSKFAYGWNSWKETNIVAETMHKYSIQYNYMNNRKIIIDGIERASLNATLTAPTSSDDNLSIFSSNYSSINNVSLKGKIYRLTISDSTSIIRDFIPVRIDQIGYLYDKVTDQLFGNQGTGSFILGPDI